VKTTKQYDPRLLLQYEDRSHLVLLGGGLDSTTLMVWLRKRDETDVSAIHFQYGQKADACELAACNHFCAKYDVPLYIIPFPHMHLLGSSAILRTGHLGANPAENKLEGRNAILTMMAATFAAGRGMTTLHLGYHQEPPDAPFPDATSAALGAMQGVLDAAYSTRLYIRAPFHAMSRLRIVELARKLDPELLIESHTCYEGIVGGCGRCVHCLQKAAMLRHLETGEPLVMPENR
jgi:7-cyano-7-deazaguanine synthase